jgi:hypothetical protein
VQESVVRDQSGVETRSAGSPVSYRPRVAPRRKPQAHLLNLSSVENRPRHFAENNRAHRTIAASFAWIDSPPGTVIRPTGDTNQRLAGHREAHLVVEPQSEFRKRIVKVRELDRGSQREVSTTQLRQACGKSGGHVLVTEHGAKSSIRIGGTYLTL